MNLSDGFKELPEIEPLFEQYIKEMRFLRNFSERTLQGYREVFKRWQKYAGGIPTEERLSDYVIGMREAGLNTTTCNISIRATNAFLTWLKDKKVIENIRIKRLPEEKRKMRVFDDDKIKAILSFKPKGRNEQRIYAMACLFIDTGLRFSEAKTIQTSRVNFDNLFITVSGKGKKERIIPMSLELRKVLYRYFTKYRESKFESPYFFCTLNGTPVLYDNARRDLLDLFKQLGLNKADIDGFFHSFRRKFARSYIKNGGNVFYLQHAMGHSTLDMTKHYVEVEDEDLKAAHLQVSIMSRLR
jgi:site-specific recombinase XerD